MRDGAAVGLPCSLDLGASMLMTHSVYWALWAECCFLFNLHGSPMRYIDAFYQKFQRRISSIKEKNACLITPVKSTWVNVSLIYFNLA